MVPLTSIIVYHPALSPCAPPDAFPPYLPFVTAELDEPKPGKEPLGWKAVPVYLGKAKWSTQPVNHFKAGFCGQPLSPQSRFSYMDGDERQEDAGLESIIFEGYSDCPDSPSVMAYKKIPHRLVGIEPIRMFLPGRHAPGRVRRQQLPPR